MKRVLKWIGIVVVLAVVGVMSFGTWVQWYLLPDGDFSTQSVPNAPKYEQDKYWAALPSQADTADLVPPNAAVEHDLSDMPADVFFIHSTGYVGPGGWNSTMDKSQSEAQSLEYMLSSMASAFNGCCEIYAPIYRQAHLAAFGSEDTQSSYQALDLAYQDVERAFDYFITHHNNDRPFIIVGHSQGSLHALRLIANRVDSTALQGRMIAAYTIGYWLPMDMFERNFEQIGLCASPTDTQCIVSYDTYGDGGGVSQQYRHWYKSGWEVSASQPIACVNPLSWQVDTQKVPATEHKGAFPVEFKRTFAYMLLAKNPGFVFDELPELTSQLTWAQCTESGELLVQRQQDNPFSNHLDAEDGSYHLLDYSLFYGNIRENAIVRTKVYLQQHAQP